MGCYTQWYTYMNSGSAEFEAERRNLYAKFMSLKHVIDYYFAIENKKLPSARYADSGSQYDLIGDDEFSDSDYQTLCRHLACDEVHYSVLLDVETILNRDNFEACKYAYVLMRCMVRLRSSKGDYYPDVPAVSDDMQKPSGSGWFSDVPH